MYYVWKLGPCLSSAEVVVSFKSTLTVRTWTSCYWLRLTYCSTTLAFRWSILPDLQKSGSRVRRIYRSHLCLRQRSGGGHVRRRLCRDGCWDAQCKKCAHIIKDKYPCQMKIMPIIKPVICVFVAGCWCSDDWWAEWHSHRRHSDHHTAVGDLCCWDGMGS